MMLQILVAAVLVLVVICVVLVVHSQRKSQSEVHLLRNDLAHLNKHLSQSLTDTRHSVQEDLKHSSLLLSDLSGKLGELAESSRQIHDIGKNIATLQDLLRAPKLRGGMGEYFLEDILSQILPRASYQMQYSFRSGHIIDAVIRLGDRLVCIDSKFPLEIFRQMQAEKDEARVGRLKKEFIRGIKKHADDIASKYILPLEKTYDFALMYIPAENVYYEAVIKGATDSDSTSALFEYAIEKKVIPVSPNSIYAYLQVILLGLKGFQIEGQTKEILKRLSGLKQELTKVENEFDLVSKHLNNTSKSFDKAQTRLGQFSSKVQLLENPESEDRPSVRNQQKVTQNQKTLQDV